MQLDVSMTSSIKVWCDRDRHTLSVFIPLVAMSNSSQASMLFCTECNGPIATKPIEGVLSGVEWSGVEF